MPTGWNFWIPRRRLQFWPWFSSAGLGFRPEPPGHTWLGPTCTRTHCWTVTALFVWPAVSGEMLLPAFTFLLLWVAHQWPERKFSHPAIYLSGEEKRNTWIFFFFFLRLGRFVSDNPQTKRNERKGEMNQRWWWPLQQVTWTAPLDSCTCSIIVSDMSLGCLAKWPPAIRFSAICSTWKYRNGSPQVDQSWIALETKCRFCASSNQTHRYVRPVRVRTICNGSSTRVLSVPIKTDDKNRVQGGGGGGAHFLQWAVWVADWWPLLLVTDVTFTRNICPRL